MCKSFFFLLFATPLLSSPSLRCLSLDGAEQIALEYNKTFLIAQESSIQAKERKSQALSRFFPALDYRAEFREITRKELFFNVFSEKFTFSNQGYSSILQVSQPIFSTDLWFGLKAKSFEAESYEYSKAQTKNELLLGVRQRYFAVLLYERALEIERENIDYLAFALKQEQGKLEAGNSTPFEVNQSKTALANSISLYYTTLKELKTARNSFILTLGIDPLLEPELSLSLKQMPIKEIPELCFKLEELKSKYRYRSDTFPSTEDYLLHIEELEKKRSLTLFSKKEVEEYLNLALSLRPDLLAKKTYVETANQELNEKLGTYLPKVSGYARYSYNDIELGTIPFLKEPYNWSVGFVLTWNLFDSLLREHEVKEARSVKTASQIGYAQEWQRIEAEIYDGLYQLQEAMLGYESATQAVFVASQARLQAQEKLQFGRIAPLEYRDSVNQLCQAKNLQNKASFSLLAAYYQIRYATGMDTNIARDGR